MGGFQRFQEQPDERRAAGQARREAQWAAVTRARAEATARENKILEDQSMWMLMTARTPDGVVSETAKTYLKLRPDLELRIIDNMTVTVDLSHLSSNGKKYLKLRQGEALRKLKKRLAETEAEERGEEEQEQEQEARLRQEEEDEAREKAESREIWETARRMKAAERARFVRRRRGGEFEGAGRSN